MIQGNSQAASNWSLTSQVTQTGYAEPKAARESEIPHQIDIAQRNMTGVHEAISALNARLSGAVMRPELPSPETKSGQIRAAMQTSIGDQIQNLNDALVEARMRLESMAARLEI